MEQTAGPVDPMTGVMDLIPVPRIAVSGLPPIHFVRDSTVAKSTLQYAFTGPARSPSLTYCVDTEHERRPRSKDPGFAASPTTSTCSSEASTPIYINCPTPVSSPVNSGAMKSPDLSYTSTSGRESASHGSRVSFGQGTKLYEDQRYRQDSHSLRLFDCCPNGDLEKLHYFLMFHLDLQVISIHPRNGDLPVFINFGNSVDAAKARENLEEGELFGPKLRVKYANGKPYRGRSWWKQSPSTKSRRTKATHSSRSSTSSKSSTSTRSSTSTQATSSRSGPVIIDGSQD